jgi:hypothetical protein
MGDLVAFDRVRALSARMARFSNDVTALRERAQLVPIERRAGILEQLDSVAADIQALAEEVRFTCRS